MFTKVGAEVFAESRQAIADSIARELEAYLDAWHSLPEVYDNELDAWLHEIYTKSLRGKPVYPPRDVPYFSPSSANSDPRELYEKLRGSKKDAQKRPPHQGRWTRIGTAIGDVIQRDLLFAEKHYEKATGKATRFTFERNADGTPVFEDFAKKAVRFGNSGSNFAIYGTCDGIMRYVTDDGEIIRVGLEVKSKQTTCAKTSEYSTRNGPQEDHVKQVTCYSLMYGTGAPGDGIEPIDYYVILNVNASKKAWALTPEEYAKNPDIKAYGVVITDEMRRGIVSSFGGIVDAAAKGEAPPLDIEQWTFNNYKTACARGLTDAELDVIERSNDAIQRSTLPDFKKRHWYDAVAEIKRIRAEVA